MAYDKRPGGKDFRPGQGAKDNRSGNRTGERWYENRTPGKSGYSGNRPASVGDRPIERKNDQRPAGDRPAFVRPGDKRPVSARPYEARPAGDRPAFARPGDKRPVDDRPADRRTNNGPGEHKYDRNPGGRPASYPQAGGNRPERPYEGGNRPERKFESRPGERGYSRPFDRRPEARTGDLGTAPRRAVPPSQPIPPSREQFAPRTAPVQPVLPALDPAQEAMNDNLLVGRNSVREALKAGISIEKLLVTNGELTGSAGEILALAREKGVVIQYVDRARLDAVTAHHQGMLAYASAAEYDTLEDILALAEEKGEPPFVVVLDGITDPHNLGAIIRSAECMGAHGVIVPERRSAGLNPAAVRAAAGALSYIKVARVVNLTRTLDLLKEKGLWVSGAVMNGTPIEKCSLTGPIALVIGSEGDGISPLVQKNCDQLVALALYGHIESLNASVAAGIILREIAKARHA
ncbi:MAG: 23S rRNA (guanosine(2251)-2'-O)-methyltransferase RlmB [Clostridia bacterium]